jgi:hypothetical protein
VQFLRRHKGIGSLPSATTTACSARLAELPGGGTLVGIALYKAASAKMVSMTSTTLFIGGVSFAHTSARREVYAQIVLCEQWRPVDNCCFLRIRRCESAEGGGQVRMELNYRWKISRMAFTRHPCNLAQRSARFAGLHSSLFVQISVGNIILRHLVRANFFLVSVASALHASHNVGLERVSFLD